MRFLELLIQGIRQFPSLHQLTFDPAKNWVFLPSGEGKTTLFSLIRAIFDHTYFLRIQESLIPRHPLHEISRFALAFAGDKGNYRILKDARNGATRLFRFDPATGKYLPHLDSPEKIEGFLADEFDFPGPVLYSQLYLWSEAISTGGVNPTPLESPLPVQDTEKEILRRLEALEEEKTLLQSVRELQFELDGYQDERFKLEKELEKLNQRIRETERIEQELNRTEKAEELPLHLLEKAKNFEKFRDLTQRKLNDLNERIEREERGVEELKSKPRWHHDPVFLGVSAGTFLGFLVPPFFKLYFLAILGFIGLGVLGFIYWRYHKLDEEIKAREKNRDELREQMERLERESSSEEGLIESLVRELNLISPKDLAALREERKKLKEQWENLKKQAEEEKLVEKIADLEKQKLALEEKIQNLSQKLEEIASAEKDLGMIEREVEKLKKELTIMRRGGTLLTFAEQESFEKNPMDEMAMLLRAGLKVSRKTEKSFFPALNQILLRLTPFVFGKRFKAVEIKENGEILWLDAEKGEPIPIGELHPSVLSATRAILTLAILNYASETRVFPCVWDEPLMTLDDLLLNRIGGVMEKFSTRFQILVFSGRKALGSPLGNPLAVRRSG